VYIYNREKGNKGKNKKCRKMKKKLAYEELLSILYTNGDKVSIVKMQ